MLAAPRLFSLTLPIQSAGVSGKGIITMQAKNQGFAIFLTPIISHYPLFLRELGDTFT
jgi:hypothetical protein